MSKKIEISKKFKNEYDNYYSDETKEWRELGAKDKVNNIVSITKKYRFKSLLEVGAGDGSILEELNRIDFCENLYGIEISSSGIDFIKKRKISKLKGLKLFDGYNIPYDDNFFDIAILSHVLEHVEYPRAILREIKRVSKYQIIEVPRDYSYNVDRKIKGLLKYGHINVYTPTLLRFLIKSEKFRIISDKMSFYSEDIVKYSYKTNNNMSIINKMKLNIFLILRNIAFNLVSNSRKETMINTYTIFTRKPH